MPSPIVRDLLTAPNLITLSRIALVLAGAPILLLWSPAFGIALGVLAGLTDYADGMVARRTGQVTRLGEILDQVGDLIYESLLLLIAVVKGFFPPAVLYLYLFREFWVLCIRRYLDGIGKTLASTLVGKLKSNFINWGFLPAFLSMSGLLPQLEPFLKWLGMLGGGLGLVASYVSGIGYTRAFIAGYNAHAVTHPQNARKG
jgi:phosphatidylglycerophosphate synthase